MIVTLDMPEFYRAAQIGSRRLCGAMMNNCRHKYGGEKRDPWGTNIGGAQGELAAAKALGVEWPACLHVQAKDEPDLPPDWQVRTRLSAKGELGVRPDDCPHHRFILVVACAYPKPVFDVRGWIFAADAMRSEWRHDYGYGPVFYVPQDEAHAMGLWHALEVMA